MIRQLNAAKTFAPSSKPQAATCRELSRYNYSSTISLRSVDANALKCMVFLTDMSKIGEMNKVYEKYFPHKPARSCIGVKALPLGVAIEIECIALANERSKL